MTSLLLDKSQRILILGYGVSGTSTANFLKNKGFEVFIHDDSMSDFFRQRSHSVEKDFDILVKSPGIPFMPNNAHFWVKKAMEKKIPILSNYDIWSLFNPKARVVCITGTNGKSTTTALITHILQKSGKDAVMGGNIGIPYGDISQKHDIYIFEMSSYELAISKYMNFEVCCLLNIAPDHLENHGSFENYVEAKYRALDYSKIKVINSTDKITVDKYDSGTIVVSQNGIELPDNNCPSLKGRHNKENAAFAYEVCRYFGIFHHEIIRHMESFEALPHRMNVVRVIGNTIFVNDSKATNPDSAARALDSYYESHKIFWLVGGRSKGIDPLPYIDKYITMANNIYKIYLFGESMAEFEEKFGNKTIKCGSIENALKSAYNDAISFEKGQNVVLFSPMCTSFDQFKNFSERGEFFTRLVQEL
ncbi:MAG: UDP-N-acetylmuramoyl-L-alanine--D-glutamate ligase [Holosporales bacterium]|jgi:UDP-N-acetylmuramoylalanine--D-glutamate ligase|nr:UDP-N-acetylmuramoyl-L-alanine--D-glutamate ligase [Holosporales bacterium]